MFLISVKYKVLVYTLFDAINQGDYAVASLISGFMILLSLAFTFLLGRVQNLILKGCRVPSVGYLVCRKGERS